MLSWANAYPVPNPRLCQSLARMWGMPYSVRRISAHRPDVWPPARGAETATSTPVTRRQTTDLRMSPSGVVVREIVLLGKFIEPTARVCARIGHLRSPARVRPSIARRRDFSRTKRGAPDRGEGNRTRRDARCPVPADGHSRGIRMTSARSEEHTSELQSLTNLVCRLLL